MTDEEKAEKEANNYKIDLCAYCRECEKGNCSHTDDAIFGYKDGYKKGLAEGRKENTKLEKENEELKAHCKAVDEVNEKMKCCHNCKNFIDKSYCITPCSEHSEWELAE